MGIVTNIAVYQQKAPDNKNVKTRQDEQLNALMRKVWEKFAVRHFKRSTRRSYSGAIKKFIYYRRRVNSKATGAKDRQL